MTAILPATPQDPPEPAPDLTLEPGLQADLAALAGDLSRTAATPPCGDDQGQAWATVIVVFLVLGSTSAMLLTGHDVHESLLLAGGVTLLSVAIARRILADGALLPTIAIAGVVAAFALVLVIRGYPSSEVAVICGAAGLLAGEVTARVLRPGTPRREM
jgi:hypothetical protein